LPGPALNCAPYNNNKQRTFSSISALTGRQLKQSVKVRHRRML
jgi:hypothetical protein